MRILVTGATGFIGSHLTPALCRAGHEVHALVRPETTTAIQAEVRAVHCLSLRDPEVLRAHMEALAPDMVIHLASLTLPGDQPSDFDEHYHHTVQPALNMARAVPDCVRLALFFGSSIEYGNQTPPFLETQPPQCCSPYAWGKIAALYGVTEILSMRKIPGCWARPFLTFGPGPMRSQLIPSLIRGCLEARRIPLTGGAQIRDFVCVADLCAMVLRLLDAPERAAGQVINLASGTPRTIRSVAEGIRSIIGRGELDFGALPYRPHEPMELYGSTAKYESLFGPVPETPFERGMAITVEAYRS